MKELLLFDVNETLLDLRALRPRFARAFGDGDVLGLWFAQLLRLALVATLTDNYADFGRLGADALEMTARRLNTQVGEQDSVMILTGMRSLPAHPEVPAGLARLQEAGFRLAALTNSPPDAASDQLHNAGLAGYFERILSVHSTGRFKPAPETYRYAARELGVPLGGMRMIAAHDWDVAGALSAGCLAAFIARPGMVLGATLPAPDIVGQNLSEVAEMIIARRLEVD